MNASLACTRIIPIGGVGEFGANATIIQTPASCILIDFGLMFPPDHRQPGVEYYINDPELLLAQFPNLSAIFVTHAHEDHIGALGFLLERAVLPIYTTAYTAQLIANTLSYHPSVRPEIRVIPLGEAVSLGDFSVIFHSVTHSIVGATALVIHTPDGTLFHSGDFKVDPLPQDGYPFDSDSFARLGKEGVDLLIMDSTNASRPGFCPSEYELLPTLERQIRGARGRVFLTTFSSHMPRIRNLIQIAQASGRRLAFIGRSFRKHFKACLDTGYLGTTTRVVIDEDSALRLSDHEVLYIVAGAQAEARSALGSIAKGGFRGISFKAGDRLIFSARSIPGNERQVMLFVSELERRGVEVVTAVHAHVHASGHAYREDAAYLLRLLQPRHVAPIHGEFHHLLAHHRWLSQLIDDDQKVHLLEDGDIRQLDNGDVYHGGKIKTRMLPIDGNRNQPISSTALKARRDLMYTGLIMISYMSETGLFAVETMGLCENQEGEFAERLRHELAGHAQNFAGAQADHVAVILRQARSLASRTIDAKPVIRLIYNGQFVH